MKTRSLIPVVLVAALAPLLLSVTARARSISAIPIAARPVSRLSLPEDVADAPLLPIEGSTSVEIGPPPPPRIPTLRESLEGDPPPLEPSKKPTRAEWSAATAIPIEGAPTHCHSYRVREWLRVRCEYASAQQVALLSGRKQETLLSLQKRSADWFGDTAESIVFSLRPGDRRVIALTGVEMGRYASNGPSTDALLTEQWVEGERFPLLAFSQ